MSSSTSSSSTSLQRDLERPATYETSSGSAGETAVGPIQFGGGSHYSATPGHGLEMPLLHRIAEPPPPPSIRAQPVSATEQSKTANELFNYAALREKSKELVDVDVELKSLLKSHPDPQIIEIEKMILNKLAVLFARAKNQPATVTESEVSKVAELVKEMKKLVVLTTENAAKARKSSIEAEKKSASESRTPVEELPKDVKFSFSFKTSTPIRKEEETEGGVSFSFKSNADDERLKSPAQPPPPPLPSYLKDCVPADRKAEYDRLMKNLKAVQEEIECFNDQNMKQLRFALIKAVNVPINSLSTNESIEIIFEKLRMLRSLFAGSTLRTGQSRFSIRSHPTAYSFCVERAARQIVKQAEDVVSAHPESVFPLAVLALGIWIDRPEFGDLLLAHLYLKCPVVIPYYFPKESGQSDEEFLKFNGYQLDDNGNVEKQEKFIKRQSGLIRFFAALLVTPAPPAETFGHRFSLENVSAKQQLHPLPLATGWKLLSDLLNLPPKTDITAIALFEILQVAGHYFQKAYGNQLFSKFLSTLRLQYLPKIVVVTAADRRAALARLETLLEENLFMKPTGFIEF